MPAKDWTANLHEALACTNAPTTLHVSLCMSPDDRAPTDIYPVIILAFAASFFGVLFVSPGFQLLGILAFLLLFAASKFLAPDEKRDEGSFALLRMWLFVMPTCVGLFVLMGALSMGLGAPDLGDLPIIAQRDTYLFTRGAEVERWRFVTVALSFHFIWHLFLIAYAVDKWTSIAKQWRADHRPQELDPSLELDPQRQVS